MEELSRKNRELAERSKSRRSEFKLVGTDIVKQEPDVIAAPVKPACLLDSPGSTGTTTSAALHQLDRGSEYVTEQSSATWQYNSSFRPRSVISVNGGRQNEDDGLLKIRTSRSVMNVNYGAEPWPHMPAELRSVADSAQSTMARGYKESHFVEESHYNSMPALDSRGTVIRLQDESKHSMSQQPSEQNEHRELVREVREVVSSNRPRVTETIQRVEERKRTEEVERRVLRRERRHKSHRSAHRYHHASGGHQEAIGWHEGGGSAYHRSNSKGAHYNGGYERYGNGYERGYPPRAYDPNYYQAPYNGYDFPPTYPRRSASASLYH